MSKKNNGLTSQGVRNLDFLSSKSKGRVLAPVPNQCEHRKTRLDGCHIYCDDCAELLYDSGFQGRGERVRD